MWVLNRPDFEKPWSNQSNLVGIQRGPGSCPRSHSKVITWNRSPALFPKAYCPSPEKHGEGRREKRNSQTENATLERKISRGQERKLSQDPGSKLRRRLPCGQVVRRKGSDYRAARLEERERKNKNRREKKVFQPWWAQTSPASLQEPPQPSSILMYSLKQINSSIIILSTLCNFYIISFHFPLPMHQKTYNGLVKFI